MSYMLMRYVTLDQLKPKQGGRVLSIDLPPQEAQRLSEMGLVRGTVVRVSRTAAFGDPIEIEARDTYMSLRKRTAKKIVVEINEPS